MCRIDLKKIEDIIYENILRVHFDIDDSYRKLIRELKERETFAGAKKFFDLMLENANIASSEKLPLCQDTGVAVFFVEIGEIDMRITDIKNILYKATKRAYKDGYLRKSIVNDPLKRINTGDNLPPIIHFLPSENDRLKISYCAKGGGAENKAAVKMFNPTAGKDEIINFVIDVVQKAGPDACPPFFVGIGIGGNFEYAAMLAKKALLRDIGSKNPDPYYDELENIIKNRINNLKIGPMGLGGDVTAFDVYIEKYPCHIAQLPVAVNLNCHSHRHFTVKF